MATKQEVLALHKAHPEWNSGQIAAQLDCDSAYVRATFKRNGIVNAAPRRVGPVRRERERCAMICERFGQHTIAAEIRGVA